MNFYDYEIGFENTETKEYYYDILQCAFFRTPLIKQASYTILKINLPPLLIQYILNDINNNNHYNKLKFNLVIYLVDREKRYKRVKKVYYKNFVVINLELLENFLPNKDRLSCRLLLVNPVLHYMNNTNTFNKIFENITAYEAIEKYESFLKQTYGDTFYINHISPDVNKSTFKYEQMLIKIKNDMNVPTEIINTYKPFHTFNYYFFDDFYISDECDKDISCTFLNLYDRTKLRQFDILNHHEIMQNISYIKESKFNDDFFTTDKQDETINYNHQEIIYDNPKSFKAKVPKQKTIVSEKINLIFGQDINIDRQIYYNESQNLKGMEYNNIGLSSQHTNIYTPDSVSNANKRYTLTKNLFKEIFFNITSMECIGSNIDWLQFGRLYNFEFNDKETDLFYYTPLNIIHIFQRKIMREHYLNHVMKFNCLKYKNPNRDEN